MAVWQHPQHANVLVGTHYHANRAALSSELFPDILTCSVEPVVYHWGLLIPFIWHEFGIFSNSCFCVDIRSSFHILSPNYEIAFISEPFQLWVASCATHTYSNAVLCVIFVSPIGCLAIIIHSQLYTWHCLPYWFVGEVLPSTEGDIGFIP